MYVNYDLCYSIGNPWTIKQALFEFEEAFAFPNKKHQNSNQFTRCNLLFPFEKHQKFGKSRLRLVPEEWLEKLITEFLYSRAL